MFSAVVCQFYSSYMHASDILLWTTIVYDWPLLPYYRCWVTLNVCVGGYCTMYLQTTHDTVIRFYHSGSSNTRLVGDHIRKFCCIKTARSYCPACISMQSPLCIVDSHDHAQSCHIHDNFSTCIVLSI